MQNEHMDSELQTVNTPMTNPITKIMTWNIQHGGGSRLAKILERIQHHDPDVMVLTEFRSHDKGKWLRAELASLGWTNQAASNADRKLNGVLTASRLPLEQRPIQMDDSEASRFFMEVTFNEFSLTGIYMPGEQAKIPYWDFIVEDTQSRNGQRHIYLGDLNTGQHFIDENDKTLIGSDYIEKMNSLGWFDAWRYQNPNARDGTWLSPDFGNPFRLDHAFLSPALLPDLEKSWLSHAEREGDKKVSDHSAYLLTIRGKAGG